MVLASGDVYQRRRQVGNDGVEGEVRVLDHRWGRRRGVRLKEAVVAFAADRVAVEGADMTRSKGERAKGGRAACAVDEGAG